MITCKDQIFSLLDVAYSGKCADVQQIPYGEFYNAEGVQQNVYNQYDDLEFRIKWNEEAQELFIDSLVMNDSFKFKNPKQILDLSDTDS